MVSNTVSGDLFLNLLDMIESNYKIDSDQKFNTFRSGVNYFTKFIFLQDNLIDEDINWVDQFNQKENILYDINSSYRKAFQYLNIIYSQEHPFWDYLFHEEKVYYEYIIKEKFLSTNKSEISLADFEEMTYAKHALALVPARGMEWLFKGEASYDDIKKMLVPIFNGMQMMDDIDDFYKDYEDGYWNLVQYQVQKIIKEENLVDDGSLTRFSERVFYASGICKEHSIYVLNEYQKAKNLANNFNFNKIEIWIDMMIVEIQESIAFVDKVSQE